MRIPLKYMQLHNPLFLAGINLGNKLDVAKRPMSMIYDREHQEVHVFLNNQLSIIPFPAVSDMTPIDASAFGYGAVPAPKESINKEAPKPQGKIKAQVSTPTDHVFADKAGNVRD